MSLVVRSPIAGTVIALDDVPDPVFSGRMLGPGVAVDPDRSVGEETTALAPVSGTVAKIHPHAYVIAADDGRRVLAHLGLDTVSLNGRGFTLLVAEGQTVGVGQPVISWSPARVDKEGLSPIVPVLAMEGREADLEPARPGQRVAAGDVLMTWTQG